MTLFRSSIDRWIPREAIPALIPGIYFTIIAHLQHGEKHLSIIYDDKNE